MLRFYSATYVEVGRYGYRFDENGNPTGGWIRDCGDDWRAEWQEWMALLTERTLLPFSGCSANSGRLARMDSWSASQMNPYAIPIFEQILRPFRDLGVVAFRDEYSCCDDNKSFDRIGVPGFEFIQDPIDDDTYHSNIDTYDALLLDDLKQAAVIVASTVYHLAMRDEMFPRKAQTK